MVLTTEQRNTLQKIGEREGVIPTDQPFGKTLRALSLLNEEKRQWFAENQPIGALSHQNVCRAFEYSLKNFEKDVKEYVKNEDDPRFQYAIAYGDIILKNASAKASIGPTIDRQEAMFTGTGCVPKLCPNKFCDPSKDPRGDSVLGISKDMNGTLCFCDRNALKKDDSANALQGGKYLSSHINYIL